MTNTVLNGKYQVEVHHTEKDIIPYTLVGKRGARYHVVRNFHKPHILFANIGSRTYWFEEVNADGQLKFLGN